MNKWVTILLGIIPWAILVNTYVPMDNSIPVWLAANFCVAQIVLIWYYSISN
jgi:hypothetical protein